MNQNLINQYKITLQNKVLNWGSDNEIFKSIETNNRYLNEFIDSWSVDEMDESLFPYLNKVINGTLTEYDTGSETITILIKQDLTYFLIDDVGTNYPTIPTQDFKEICLGWKEFLLTPPLNGTKVS
jgi:hypothetical protein